MGDFEQETRVQSYGAGYRAALSKSWEIWGPNGGYLSTIALRAAGAASRLRKPASLCVHYLGVASFSDVELHVVPLRTTRRAESLRVSMHQEGRPILEALVWVVEALQGLEHSAYAHPDVPPAGALKTVAERDPDADTPGMPFWNNIVRKPVDWLGSWPPERELAPITRDWYRLSPTATFSDPFVDAGRALLMIDTMQWPAAALRHACHRPGYVAPTIELSVNFHASAPEDSWLLCVAEAPVARDGLVHGTARVFSQDATLLASGTSHMLCRPVPPGTAGAV